MSPRQAQILALVAAGFSAKQIGRKLGISPRTGEAHLDRLYLRSGVYNRAAVALAWLRGGSNGLPPV